MIKTYYLDQTESHVIKKFIQDWKKEDNKVFYFTGAKLLKQNVRDFYTKFFKRNVEFKNFAEDAKIKNRNSQRTNSIWMEVRFDPKIKNAYRHSSSSQPLHTDGSYIPDYPSSTLMCCEKNLAENGETTFINAEDVAKTLKKENFSLYEELTKYYIKHKRSGVERTEKVLSFINNKWLINWNYYCIDTESKNEFKNLCENFQAFLNHNLNLKKKISEVKLGDGDAIIWKDNEILHGRNSFIPTKTSDRFFWKCAVDVL